MLWYLQIPRRHLKNLFFLFLQKKVYFLIAWLKVEVINLFVRACNNFFYADKTWEKRCHPKLNCKKIGEKKRKKLGDKKSSNLSGKMDRGISDFFSLKVCVWRFSASSNQNQKKFWWNGTE
jgi:hypothetical protein